VTPSNGRAAPGSWPQGYAGSAVSAASVSWNALPRPFRRLPIRERPRPKRGLLNGVTGIPAPPANGPGDRRANDRHGLGSPALGIPPDWRVSAPVTAPVRSRNMSVLDYECLQSTSLIMGKRQNTLCP